MMRLDKHSTHYAIQIYLHIKVHYFQFRGIVYLQIHILTYHIRQYTTNYKKEGMSSRRA